MPIPVNLAPWSESLKILDTLVGLAPKLSLVFIVGPGELAEAGLSQIGDLLADRREILWHRLDKKGARLTESLATAATNRAVLLVHGLELLDSKKRRNVERNLNLVRDVLRDHKTMIVFWIPLDELDDFRNVCPDLFHWRSHLATVNHDELEAELVARWRYLDWARAFLEEHLAKQHPEDGSPDAFVGPLVEPEDGSEPVSFFSWADEVSRGLVEGESGSGKTLALKRLALERVRRARVEHGDPIPAWVPWSDLASGPESYGLDAILRTHAPGSTTWPVKHELIEGWANRGELLLIFDGLDQAPESLRSSWVEWLQGVRIAFPRTLLLVGARPQTFSSEGWQMAELLPWNAERPRDAPKRSRKERREEHSQRLWEQGVRNFLDTLIRSLDPGFEPSGDVRREAAEQIPKFPDPRGIDALARSLDPDFEPDAGIRSVAARLLGEIGDPSVADILTRSLDPGMEPNRNTRKITAVALGRLGDPRAIATLGEFLTTKSPDHEVVKALVQIGTTNAARVLRQVLDPRLAEHRELRNSLHRLAHTIQDESRSRQGEEIDDEHHAPTLEQAIRELNQLMQLQLAKQGIRIARLPE